MKAWIGVIGGVVGTIAGALISGLATYYTKQAELDQAAIQFETQLAQAKAEADQRVAEAKQEYAAKIGQFTNALEKDHVTSGDFPVAVIFLKNAVADYQNAMDSDQDGNGVADNIKGNLRDYFYHSNKSYRVSIILHMIDNCVTMGACNKSITSSTICSIVPLHIKALKLYEELDPSGANQSHDEDIVDLERIHQVHCS